MKQETIKELWDVKFSHDDPDNGIYKRLIMGVDCTRLHTAPTYLHEWWKKSNEVVESLKRLAERTRDKGDGEYSRLIDIQIDEYEGYRKDIKDAVLQAIDYNIETDEIVDGRDEPDNFTPDCKPLEYNEVDDG